MAGSRVVQFPDAVRSRVARKSQIALGLREYMGEGVAADVEIGYIVGRKINGEASIGRSAF